MTFEQAQILLVAVGSLTDAVLLGAGCTCALIFAATWKG